MAATISKVVRLAVENGQPVIAELRRVGEVGEQAFQKIGTGAQNASRQLTQAATAATNASQAFAQRAGNIGFQVQDFFVQVEGGTPIMRAFVQQGTQVAGAFGPWGAIIGAAGAVVGVLAGKLFDVGQTAKQLPDLVDSAAAAFDKAAQTAGRYADQLQYADEKQRQLLQTLGRLRVTQLQGLADNLVSGIRSGIRDRIFQQERERTGAEGGGIGLGEGFEAGDILARGRAEAAAQAAAAQRTSVIERTLNDAIRNGDVEGVQRIFNAPGVSEDAALAALGIEAINTANEIRAAKALAEGNEAALREIAGSGAKQREKADKIAAAAAARAARPGAAAPRRGAAAAGAEERAQERIGNRSDDVIRDLELQIAKYDEAQKSFVERQIVRLPRGASQEDIASVRQYATELEALQKHEKNNELAVKRRTAALDEARRITLEQARPLEMLAVQQAKLNALHESGALSTEAYNRAMVDAIKTAEEAAARTSNDPFLGLRVGLRAYIDSAKSLAVTVRDGVQASLGALEDVFAQFVTTGKVSFRELAASAIEDLARIAYRAMVVRAITGAAGLIFGGQGATEIPTQGFLSGHTGGTVGNLGGSRRVDPRVFLNAPRFHTGGLVGDEVPIIARRGERILTAAQQAHAGRVTVNITNNGQPVQGQSQTRRGPGGDTVIDIMLEQRINQIIRRGGADSALQSRMGVRPTLAR